MLQQNQLFLTGNGKAGIYIDTIEIPFDDKLAERMER